MELVRDRLELFAEVEPETRAALHELQWKTRQSSGEPAVQLPPLRFRLWVSTQTLVEASVQSQIRPGPSAD